MIKSVHRLDGYRSRSVAEGGTGGPIQVELAGELTRDGSISRTVIMAHVTKEILNGAWWATFRRIGRTLSGQYKGS